MQFLITCLLVLVPQSASEPGPAGLRVTGGRVFDGERFVERTLFVSEGTFVDALPAGSEPATLEADGAWIIPPLADAHSHRFSTAYDGPGAREMFLSAGILYVANLCSPRDARTQVGGFIGGRTGVDALFTNGALTSTGGHPVKLYEELHSGVYRQPSETFMEVNDNSSFFQVDDLEDLDAKWPLLLASEPDLIKTILSSSEEHADRIGESRYYGHRGLDPELLEEVVRMAHSDGLRVATHVDTAPDFRAAVEAGVDWIAHTPGYGARVESELERYSLTAEDARRAKAAGVVQITTASLARTELAKEVLANNLSLLLDAGVPVAIGSDQWSDVHHLERRMLVELKLFLPIELLRAWCEDTPKALYPDRKLGRLAPGYEGSFLLLDADPLADPENLSKVRAVIKRGVTIWERDGAEARD